jgi:CheY-like chemotaxis protein
MKNVLIVDDEKTFLLSLTEGLSLYRTEFSVLTAENGKKAVAVLKANPIDLVVTDLKMPVMDGFELLAYMSKNHPKVPVMVMTAFGNPEVEAKLKALGVLQYMEKPLEFQDLANKVRENLAEGSGGYIRGITLPGFLQLVELEQKTCTLKVESQCKVGHLYFVKGDLVDAETENEKGENAAYDIISWDSVSIEIAPGSKRRKKNIDFSLSYILVEGHRLKDEKASGQDERGWEGERLEKEETEETLSLRMRENENFNFKPKEENIMTAQEKIKEFTSIEGFGGVGIFTPSGESLAMLAGDKLSIKDVGVLANNVLLNAQKASLDMGTGRGQLVHVEAERAHIIVRCLNEGTDPLKSQPGKTHIHLVLVLTSDAAIGLAKMKVDKIINDLAEDFRA